MLVPPAVCQLCNCVDVRRLKMSKEQFKCPREYSKAVDCARRWRGLEPMSCYIFSKVYPKAGGVARHYNARCRDHMMVSAVQWHEHYAATSLIYTCDSLPKT